MSELTVAVIGCGKQAPKHIGGLMSVEGVTVVVADINPDYAISLGDKMGLPWLQGIDEVFARNVIDAVDICTPTSSHSQLIRRALDARKDVFCEKPLAASAKEAKELTALTRASGRVAMVGYVYRFVPAFQWVKTLLDRGGDIHSGPLGRIVSANFRLGGRGSHQLWKHLRASHGGAFNEMLVHMVDLALWFFGPVRRSNLLIESLLRPTRDINGLTEEVDAEDFVLAELRTRSGVLVTCQADLVTPGFSQHVEIQGENGSFFGSIQPHLQNFLQLSEAACGFPAGRTEAPVGSVNLFEAQMSSFVAAVRARRPPDVNSFADSALLLETIENLRKEK